MSPHSDVAFTQCAAQAVSPLARRIFALDAGRQRAAGLRTYIVGHGDVALIDPDPASGPLMQAILESTEGERITHVLITHSHGRRSPLGAQLAERFGADVVSGATGLRDGEHIWGVDWTLQAIETPGHTPDHFAFALAEEETVFCGDLVSGWAPEVFTPPGGDLSALLASIERIRQEQIQLLAPAHGPVVGEVAAFLQNCLEDSDRRERRIVEMLGAHGPTCARRLADQMSPALRGPCAAEAHSILAHLVRLTARGDLTSTVPLSLFASFGVPPPSRPSAERDLKTHRPARRAEWDRYPLGISDPRVATRSSLHAAAGGGETNRSA